MSREGTSGHQRVIVDVIEEEGHRIGCQRGLGAGKQDAAGPAAGQRRRPADQGVEGRDELSPRRHRHDVACECAVCVCCIAGLLLIRVVRIPRRLHGRNQIVSGNLGRRIDGDGRPLRPALRRPRQEGRHGTAQIGIGGRRLGMPKVEAGGEHHRGGLVGVGIVGWHYFGGVGVDAIALLDIGSSRPAVNLCREPPLMLELATSKDGRILSSTVTTCTTACLCYQSCRR